jgi:hypothetical protein
MWDEAAATLHRLLLTKPFSTLTQRDGGVGAEGAATEGVDRAVARRGIWLPLGHAYGNNYKEISTRRTKTTTGQNN